MTIFLRLFVTFWLALDPSLAGRTPATTRQIELRRAADKLRRNAAAAALERGADAGGGLIGAWGVNAGETHADVKAAAAEAAGADNARARRAALARARRGDPVVRAREAAVDAARRADPAVLERDAVAALARRAAETFAEREVRLGRDAARHAAARAAAGDGPFFLAAPANMPSDIYLNTHERNPTAMIVGAQRCATLPCPIHALRLCAGTFLGALGQLAL